MGVVVRSVCVLLLVLQTCEGLDSYRIPTDQDQAYSELLNRLGNNLFVVLSKELLN